MKRFSFDLLIGGFALIVVVCSIIIVAIEPQRLAAEWKLVLWCCVAAIAHFRLHKLHG